jgi:hypothetical protein
VCRPPFVSTFPVTNKPLSISAFETPFLTCEPAAGERACAPKTSGEQPAKLSSLARKNGVERRAKSAFLTGSASQTEIDVTHRKQTTKKFLTGARTHISDSAAQLSNNAPQEDKCPSRR